MHITKKVYMNLQKYSELKNKDVLVSYSAGADSTALLYILNKQKESFFAIKKGHLERFILNDLISHKRQEPCSSYFSFGLLRNQKFLPVLQVQIQISKS